MQKQPHQYNLTAASDNGVDADAQTTVFEKADVHVTERIRIFWCFTDDGKWSSPKAPKPAFAGRKALYKVYLITNVAGRKRAPEDSASVKFAAEFFPMVNKVLFPEGESDSVTSEGESAETVAEA